jgi:PAS domain S-box-containing protein
MTTSMRQAPDKSASIRPSKRPSIRRILFTALGALTLMITVLSATDLYSEVTHLIRIRALNDATVLADKLYGATDKLSLERDISLSLLAAQDSDTIDELRPRLLESRRQADAALATSIAGLRGYAFQDLTDVREKIEKRFAGIGELRQAIDAAVLMPRAARDPDLTARWSHETTLLVEDAQLLWTNFLGHFVDVDAVATQQLQYKQFLRSVIDYTGRERSLIGQLIADDSAATPGQASQLLRYRGMVDAGWKGSRTVAEQSGLMGAIGPVYNDAESHYFTMRGMVKDLFYTPGASRRVRYPISAALWFDLSNQASDSLNDLTAASTAATRVHLARLVADAQGVIMVRSALCLLGLFLCGYSLWVIVARVTTPINRMIDALVATTRSQGDLHPAPRVGDEIEKLSQVLVTFQRTAEQARRAALELDKSERRLRAVLDNAIDGIMTIKANGEIASINPACASILGYDAEEVVGRVASFIWDAPETLDDVLSTAAANESGQRREVVMRRKNGAGLPADIAASEFYVERERFISIVVRDITRRKHAEETLRAHAHALERSNKELDDFAYIASHDLKEPLRGIHNHSRFLLEDNEAKLDEDSLRRLNRLLYLSQRMERLVNDLLYFSRLGRQEMAFQPTDIGAVVADVDSTLEHFLEERGATIVLPNPMPKIFCDKTRVTEVFRNLITNAVKYNDKAEKVVEIGFLAIARSPDQAPQRNVFYVRDNGRGIEPEFHHEVFRIFKRLKSEGGEEGTGVGLTFVKKIIERHGGRIWIESTPGQGATFYFTLEGAKADEHHSLEAA